MNMYQNNLYQGSVNFITVSFPIDETALTVDLEFHLKYETMFEKEHSFRFLALKLSVFFKKKLSDMCTQSKLCYFWKIQFF